MWRHALLCVLMLTGLAESQDHLIDERSVRVLNSSGQPVSLYWVHPDTRETVLMSDPAIYDGATFPLNSFVGHMFELREMPSSETGVCASPDQTCRAATFEVSQHTDQVVRVEMDFDVVMTDSETAAREEAGDVLEQCQKKAMRMMQRSGGTSADSSLQAVEHLASCVEKGVARKLELANEEIAFQARIRTDMADLLENYTCADDSLRSSPDVFTEVWKGGADALPRTVHVKHKRPSSQIHVIQDFINEDECEAMEAAARPTLHRATVADGKGGSRLSESRKAMQAGITVPWDKEEQGDPIARISRRVYDYTNHVLGLDIDEFGQEDLMSIQYFGRGMNDTEPDRYTPHCDGDCTGLPHKTGTRMATMVMYCTLPTKGGATNFRNAGVHVKPVKGNAIFFSYIDPEKLTMDTGFTEHSGCPVFEGEKKIVTQWIRHGVDTENPWDSFNTLGIKISDAINQ
eukprot:CAMPEP_0116841406 /NCGR_PEP_ID=MMETSP0418-20121206/10907_1 /TAXON_ID=1158023 /ORGANISM="Astrosyne radiata, Strain 13vi08-1A" /LENGTH=459 /DNA_ID=CAMNT_0004471829 /DNA_START=72 /DNA_END=1451 /DNA_ORIENTATION=-